MWIHPNNMLYLQHFCCIDAFAVDFLLLFFAAFCTSFAYKVEAAPQPVQALYIPQQLRIIAIKATACICSTQTLIHSFSFSLANRSEVILISK